MAATLLPTPTPRITLCFTVFVMLILAAASAPAAQGKDEAKEPPLLNEAKPAAPNWAERMFARAFVRFRRRVESAGASISDRQQHQRNDPHQQRADGMGPTSARALQYTLAPGQETAIVVLMRSALFHGERAVGIYVLFDSPRIAEAELVVRANSRRDITCEPCSIDFAKIKRGTTPTQQMMVTFVGKPKILVTEAKCTASSYSRSCRNCAEKKTK